MATPPPLPRLPPASAADFCTVLSESRRILRAHFRHFLALSVLFLLPISFSVTIFPTLLRLLLDSSSSSSSNTLHVQTFPMQSLLPLLLRDRPPQQQRSGVDARGVLIGVGYTSFLTLLSIFATCSITCSVVQGFYDRPVKFLWAIKSIGRCFFPILATLICTQAITSLIVLVSGILGLLILKGAELVIGNEISPSSPYFLGLVFSIVGVPVLVLVYLHVQWVLAYVIVVVESSYGFSPLRRSAYLVKGMRGVALSLTLFVGVLSGSLVWTSKLVIDGNGWERWDFWFQIVTTSSSLMLSMLISLSSNVVLYRYCKAMHGEVGMEYVSLPFDDEHEEVRHVVSMAYA